MADQRTLQRWLTQLEKSLTARKSEILRYEEYYDGEHPLAFATEKFREAFGGLFDEFADNWCELVVDAVEERLNVEGFRLPIGPDVEPDPERDPQAGDQDAWAMWQANQLDADSQIAHTEALICGESAALVWANDEGDAGEEGDEGSPGGLPLITIEHPLEMIVASEPGARRRRAAALKRFTGDKGFLHATLYLPDGIYKFKAPRKGDWQASSSSKWDRREVRGEPWPLPNPLGVVPVVPIRNRGRLLVASQSELKKVIPLQDAVNKLIADLMIASEFSSFRAKWATGVEIPRDPETNEPIEDFKAAVNRVWRIEDPDAEVGDFSETNLQNIVGAVEMVVQHIASQTRTPPHYFFLRGEFPSGESIKSAEAGLVAKTRRKARHFGESWEEIIRLGFAVMSDPRAQATGLETIWGDPEYRTEGEHVDATVKKVQSLGVPVEQGWEDIGYTPQQIQRFKRMVSEGDVLALAALAKFNTDPSAGAPANGGRANAGAGA